MIETRVYKSEELKLSTVISDIKETILSGKTVVFPTETVYGIGANALSEIGVKNIYKVKGRPSDNPLIMHIADENTIYEYTKNHQDYVKLLIEAFWPGPLTLVLEKKDNVPKIITGGLNTVGVRFPSNQIAREVISIAGVPICAPSANISGRPSSTLFEHVLEDFGGKVDIIIDGGKSDVGLESTVVDVTGEVPVILRPGMITKAMIESVVHGVKMSTHLSKDDIPKAPGMKYKHYAPKGELILISGDKVKIIPYINEQLLKHKKNQQKVGLIVTKDLLNTFDADYIFSIGDESNELEIASNLFAGLRSMDQQKVDYIYSLTFENGKYGEAIMNRLMKAANQHILHIK